LRSLAFYVDALSFAKDWHEGDGTAYGVLRTAAHVHRPQERAGQIRHRQAPTRHHIP